MALLRFFQTMALRRKQRWLLRAIDSSSVRYSNSPGISLENPVVITGAGDDIIGTMSVDWRIRARHGDHYEQRHIDIYEIQTRFGVNETFYFDVTESYGKLRFHGAACHH